MFNSLLSALIWFPVLGGVAVLAGTAAGVHPNILKATGVAISGLSLLLSLMLFFSFDSSLAGMQFVEDSEWIARFGIRYGLGVDGFSVLMM